MYKTEKLYVIYEDDSGHKYLIPKDEYGAFVKCLSRIEDSFDHHRDEDTYYEELNGLLEYLSKHTLEGEPYYVVLPEDLIKEESNK